MSVDFVFRYSVCSFYFFFVVGLVETRRFELGDVGL